MSAPKPPSHPAEAVLWGRRTFLQTSGLLVASIAAVSIEGVEAILQQAGGGTGPYPDIDFLQLDSWIVIRRDNTATFYVGKTDLGQGTGTAFRQIMSDELDIAFENTTCVMGSTDATVDQFRRIRCAADRRVSDAPRRGGSAPCAPRNGRAALRRAGDRARCERRRDQHQER